MEALRLHSNVPGNSKRCTRDTVLPGSGAVLKAGDNVFFSNYVIGRSKAIWGEDAAEFRPERYAYRLKPLGCLARLCLPSRHCYLQQSQPHIRWIDESGSIIKPNPYAFPHFNAGKWLFMRKDSLTICRSDASFLYWT